MSITFEDNSMRVLERLKDSVKAFLYEAGGEIQAKTVRNSRTDMGQTKNSYKYKVIEESSTSARVEVGSDLMNAIYEEYGTGEYAVNGDGRKGGWYIHESQLSPKAQGLMKKIIGKNGKVFYYTKGKKPNKPLKRAYDSSKDGLINRLKTILESNLS